MMVSSTKNMPSYLSNKRKNADRAGIKRVSFQAIFQGCIILLIAIAIGSLVNLFHPDQLPLIESGSIEDIPIETSFGNIEKMSISTDEAQKLFHTGSAIFIDARSPELYLKGHIPGALNIPFESLMNFSEFSDLNNPDNVIVAYSSDEESVGLSINLAMILTAMVEQNIYYLEKGWKEWEENNLPAEK